MYSSSSFTYAIIGIIIIISGLLLPTILLPSESSGFTQLSTTETIVLFFLTAISSLIIITIITKFLPQWRNYAVGSITGAALGSLIIAIVVWAYSQAFFSPTGYFKTAIDSSFIPIIFIWTFATEIPFILLIGPPIIKASQKAFPFLIRNK